MKIYVVGASKEEIAEVEKVCSAHGWSHRLMDIIGRRKNSYPVQNILDAYGKTGTIRGAAQIVHISPGTVRRILIREGVLTVNKKGEI